MHCLFLKENKKRKIFECIQIIDGIALGSTQSSLSSHILASDISGCLMEFGWRKAMSLMSYVNFNLLELSIDWMAKLGNF